MRPYIIALLALVITTTGFAQTVQRGVVKEYLETQKKKDLPGVELVIKNAGSTVSDTHGKFELRFRTLTPGDKVVCSRIAKEGYEIFNLDAIDQWFISRDNTPFTIVLCRSDRFRRIKENYESVSSESYARQRKAEEMEIRRKLEEGAIREVEYYEALQRIKDAYDEKLENLDFYIDRFSRIDLSEISKAERAIILLVQKGEIDNAIAAYEELKLEEQYLESLSKQTKAEAAISRLKRVAEEAKQAKDGLYASIKIKNQMLYLAGGKENFRKIEESLTTITANDELNYEALADLAEFYLNQRNFSKSIPLYLRLLEAEQTVIPKWKICNNLGGIHEEMADYDQSEYYYKKGISIIESDKDNLEDYGKHISNAYNSIGSMYTSSRRYKEASSYLSKAKELRDNPQNDEELLLLLSTIDNLGSLYVESGEVSEAITVFEEGSRLFDRIKDKHTPEYQEQYVTFLGNAATAYHANREYDKALKAYNDSHDIYEELSRNNPDRYLLDLIGLYTNMGILYNDLRQLDDAEKYLSLARESFKQYETINPGTALFQHANVLSTLGVLYIGGGRLADGITCCEEAISLLAKQNLDIPRVGYLYSMVHMNLASAQMYSGAIAESLENFRISAEAADRLYADNELAYGQFCMMSHHNRGLLLDLLQQWEQSETEFSKAIQISEHIAALQPEAYGHLLPMAVNSLAYCYAHWGKFDKAFEQIDRCIAMNPQDANTYDSKGEFLLMTGDDKGALEMWHKVLELDPAFLQSHQSGLHDTLLEKGMIN